ncbi:hypothetical protein [Bacillus suaedaesalsae]|uniref:Uncharacterized protein n=1 Tax=Bacillus suaedaesalsae TaxID=2810349 RepID=A0ABS2DJR9_9BACI|nr:hypothetical protein [Bacillus suaedaesalsae]MBM6617801.1 hypothetical protein [Bacillus suaedaesalsae]
MYNLLIVIGIVVCIWQFFLAKKKKVKTSLLLAILFSVIVVLMILGELAVLKLFVLAIAIILWFLFIWSFVKR